MRQIAKLRNVDYYCSPKFFFGSPVSTGMPLVPIGSPFEIRGPPTTESSSLSCAFGYNPKSSKVVSDIYHIAADIITLDEKSRRHTALRLSFKTMANAIEAKILISHVLKIVSNVSNSSGR